MIKFEFPAACGGHKTDGVSQGGKRSSSLGSAAGYIPRQRSKLDYRLWLFLAFLACLPALAAEPALRFSQVTITLGEDNQIYLDTQISYQLNDTVIEALQNGVSLTFATDVQMRSTNAWFWQPDVKQYHLHHVLRYRALSGLYEVVTHDDTTQVFATPSAALRYLGRIRDLVLAQRSQLNPDQQYLVRLIAYLDLTSLPLPLRPQAHLSSAWSLQSEPWEWQLKP